MLTSLGLLEKIAGNDVKQSAEEKKQKPLGTFPQFLSAEKVKLIDSIDGTFLMR